MDIGRSRSQSIILSVKTLSLIVLFPLPLPEPLILYLGPFLLSCLSLVFEILTRDS